MTDVITNQVISGIHAANMKKQLREAKSEAGLKSIADLHAPFLLDKHRDSLRRAYATALRRLRKEPTCSPG
jgi:hypothetical protein